MRNIKIIPTGGLCNRMRAIASGIFIADRLHTPATIYWNNSRGLKANFADLFCPINSPSVKLIENKKWIFNIGSTREYLYRWPILQLLYSRHVIFNYSTNKGDIFKRIKENKKNMMLISCYKMSEVVKMSDLFIPQPHIQKLIDSITSTFASHTVGVHIRRTDNVASISESPVELFIEAMQAEIDQDNNVRFYLASDDESVKEQLRNTFPNRIISMDQKADRESLDGMINGVVELFCLSKTAKIYGSYASSYSQTAAEIGNTEYVQILKSNPVK